LAGIGAGYWLRPGSVEKGLLAVAYFLGRRRPVSRTCCPAANTAGVGQALERPARRLQGRDSGLSPIKRTPFSSHCRHLRGNISPGNSRGSPDRSLPGNPGT